MKSSLRAILPGLIGSGLLLAAVGVAQGPEDPFATTEALDTLSQGGTSSSAGNIALDRARDVANQQPYDDGSGIPVPPAGGGDPFAIGAPPPAGGFGVQPTQAIQNVQKIKAFFGTRIYCAVTGELLNDAKEISVAQTFSNDYYDDGVNGNDAVAGDLKFTNVTIRKDAMSPEAHLIVTRTLRALEIAEEKSPNEFFVLQASSTEPLSDLPKVLDLEEDRDEKLMLWANRFFRDFLVNPDAKQTGEWNLIETYMPPPPHPPRMNIPASFFPPVSTGLVGPDGEPIEGGSAQAALGDRMGTGNIQNNPAASSGYMGGYGTN